MPDKYLQPEFYRFNQDSLLLVEWIKSKRLDPEKILDLGAGCGVIGIELKQIFKHSQLTLVEIQSEFIPYLNHNINAYFENHLDMNIVQSSFKEFRQDQKFNLIVCNPPYYLPGKGELPKSEQRAIARSFIKDDWSDLIQCISFHLDSKGSAFIVLKKDQLLFKKIDKLCQQFDLLVHPSFENDLMYLELTCSE